MPAGICFRPVHRYFIILTAAYRSHTHTHTHMVHAHCSVSGDQFIWWNYHFYGWFNLMQPKIAPLTLIDQKRFFYLHISLSIVVCWHVSFCFFFCIVLFVFFFTYMFSWNLFLSQSKRSLTPRLNVLLWLLSLRYKDS